MKVVPGRPSARALTFWVLSEDATPPAPRLTGDGAQAAQLSVLALGGPADPAPARRMFIIACENLIPDRRYRLEVFREGLFSEAWSRTLPERLTLAQPFTVAFGSCHCVARSRGIERCYPPKLHAGDIDPIRFRVLGGDQIYMDAKALTGGPELFEAPDPYDRYLKQWNGLLYSSWLGLSPNLALADDHEFWNDYPHKSFWLLWSESKPNGPLGRRMDRAFAHFQAALNVEASAARQAGASLPDELGQSARTFQLDVAPLSFFFLDTRTARTRYDEPEPHFCPPATLGRASAWARSLTGPGVLVIPQPLVTRRASSFARATHAIPDVNLPDYAADYGALWEALLAAPHDVVILTGDIHYCRLYRVSREPLSRRRVYEVVSSPFARIPSPANADRTSSGTLDLRGGNGRWLKYYADDPPAAYATATFKPQSGHVELSVAFWVTGAGGARRAAELPGIALA